MALAIGFAPPKWKSILLLLVILPFWTNLLIRTYALIAVLRTRGYVNVTLEAVWEQADRLLTILGLGQLQLLGESFEPLPLLYNNYAVVVGLVYVHLPFMALPPPSNVSTSRSSRRARIWGLDISAASSPSSSRWPAPASCPA